MNNILKKQTSIQMLLENSMLKGGVTPPYYMRVDVGSKYDTISSMQTFLNQEIDELLIEIGDGTRNIHKPWKKECSEIRDGIFVSTSDVKGEAMDVLCFALNICIAAGITPENIESEYDAVSNKIMRRIRDE